MNKKLIYSLIAGTMFTLTSCDDFLDVQPASGFTPEYIFSSESEMKALMTRIYSSMTEDGLYVMLYTAWNRNLPRLAVATSRDLKNCQYQWLGYRLL